MTLSNTEAAIQLGRQGARVVDHLEDARPRDDGRSRRRAAGGPVFSVRSIAPPNRSTNSRPADLLTEFRQSLSVVSGGVM